MDRRMLVVVGAWMTQFTVIGLLFSYSVLLSVFEDTFGWSRTMLAACTSLSFFMMGVLAIPAGRLNDRYGPRLVLGVAGVVFGLGFAAISTISAPWHLFLIFGTAIALGMSTHDVVTLSTIARWYDRRRGMMTGLVKVGTAAGQATLPPLAAFLIVTYGWQTAISIMGLSAAVVLVLSALATKQPPVPVQSGHGTSPLGMTYDEARRTRLFWTLCALQFLFFPTLTTVPLHIVVHGRDMGLSFEVATGLLSVTATASVAGRLAVGAFSDRIGGRNAYRICFALLCVALVALLVTETPIVLFPVMAVYGFAHGGFFTVVSPTVAELFGTRAQGAIFGVVLFFGTIGGAVGPTLAGWIFDTWGTYTPAFALLLAMSLCGLALVQTLPKPDRRLREQMPTQ